MFDPHVGPQTSRLQIIRNHAEWFPYILRWHVRGKLIWFLALVTMLSKDSSRCIQTYILGLIKQLLLIQESLQNLRKENSFHGGGGESSLMKSVSKL